jgi:hypothetical protein
LLFIKTHPSPLHANPPLNTRSTTLVSTGNAGPGLPARVAAVLGPKVAALLQPVDVDVPEHGARITGCVASCVI